MWGEGAAPTIATFIITDEIAVLVVDKNVKVGVTVARHIYPCFHTSLEGHCIHVGGMGFHAVGMDLGVPGSVMNNRAI